MGRDKARLPFEGGELWQRQVRVLAEAGAEPVRLVLRAGQRTLGWRGGELRDAAREAGPLAGIVAALRESRAPFVAVLAVDLPAIDAAWFRRLRRSCRRGVGAVAQGARGFEPLAAIFPREAGPIAERRLAAGKLGLQGLIGELARGGWMRAVAVSRREESKLANWNAPEDWLAAPRAKSPTGSRGRSLHE